VKNPFDLKNEKEKFEFFNQMTGAINEWMLKQYPEFDQNLINKLRKVELSQSRLDDLIREHKDLIVKEKEEYIKNAIKQINDFLSKEYPDIDGNLRKSSDKLEKFSKNAQEQLKQFKVYKSLCDDVYKLKDEFEEIKKFMEGFKKKVKKAFEL